MRYCECCKGQEGTEHVTVIVDAFGPEITERMYAQFWLCRECVRTVRELFARDDGLKSRIAAALTATVGALRRP